MWLFVVAIFSKIREELWSHFLRIGTIGEDGVNTLVIANGAPRLCCFNATFHGGIKGESMSDVPKISLTNEEEPSLIYPQIGFSVSCPFLAALHTDSADVVT